MTILGKDFQYFRSLSPYLQQFSLPVFFPALPPAGYIEERARALSAFLDQLKAERIDLIAHSMGGLDCRYVIHHFNSQRRIRTLTTITTPHHGSPLAQWVIDGEVPFSACLRRLALPALYDLTPQSCKQFNAEIGDDPDVIYRSYAAMRPVGEMPLLFRPWTEALSASDGDNDSQVPVASARWGEFKGILRADHVELTGWNMGWRNTAQARPFEHLRFYASLVQELAASG